MRLFQTGEFYMHDSSRLSAEWLNDRDTTAYVRNTGMLLSSVLQFHTLERNTALWQPDSDVLTTCSDVTQWLSASCHNVAWMIDYYVCLSDKCARAFRHKPLSWEFKNTLKNYLIYFDDADTDARSWLPMTCGQARRSYMLSVKYHSYRKVRIPYWFPERGGIGRPCHATLEIPQYDLSPLGLSPLDDPQQAPDPSPAQPPQ